METLKAFGDIHTAKMRIMYVSICRLGQGAAGLRRNSKRRGNAMFSYFPSNFNAIVFQSKVSVYNGIVPRARFGSANEFLNWCTGIASPDIVGLLIDVLTKPTTVMPTEWVLYPQKFADFLEPLARSRFPCLEEEWCEKREGALCFSNFSILWKRDVSQFCNNMGRICKTDSICSELAQPSSKALRTMR